MSNNHPTKPETAKSWTVEYRNRKPVLVPSGWQPGYTKAHFEEAADAIQYEIDRCYAEIERLRANILELAEIAGKAAANAERLKQAWLDPDGPTEWPGGVEQ